jgi:murein DD-endopeptidase MepM/ murein hydrolase activator NlpD
MLKIFPFLIIPLIFISCTPQIGNDGSFESPVPSQTFEATVTQTVEPSATPIPPTSTPELINSICSPLEGETLNTISEILTQKFIMPRPGNDDGHQGLDFAFYRRNERVGIEGLQVHSALKGKVVAVLNDRWPYGNAVIIETPLKTLSRELLAQIKPPVLEPTVIPAPRVNCPPGDLPFSIDPEERSLYLLYGHLLNPLPLIVGEEIECGQIIGEVGNTGYSSNPHLHFETRVGPSGASFDSMAYYIVQSTVSERYNYCVWRVSNLFQLFDPMLLLSAQEQ